MGRRWRIIVLLLLLSAIALQFVPVQLPQNDPNGRNDLITTTNVPEDVKDLLMQGCYDCHSQQVRYPWYAYIAPTSWLVAKDVREGREELDFSSWGTLSKRKQIGALSDIAEQVEQEKMPLPIYAVMHARARFTDEERARIIDWSETAASEIFGE